MVIVSAKMAVLIAWLIEMAVAVRAVDIRSTISIRNVLTDRYNDHVRCPLAWFVSFFITNHLGDNADGVVCSGLILVVLNTIMLGFGHKGLKRVDVIKGQGSQMIDLNDIIAGRFRMGISRLIQGCNVDTSPCRVRPICNLNKRPD